MRLRRFCELFTAFGILVLMGALFARQANATALSPADSFYWTLPAINGNPYDQQGAIAASPDGSFVYIADEYGNTVEEYTSDGTYLHAIRPRGLSDPTGVTTDLSGDVYVVYEAQGVVAKLTAGLKLLATWSVPFARSIAADRAGHLWVLTNFLDAVGEYDNSGKSIGGFAATNWPGAYFDFDGYDAPYKWVATAITVDQEGRPIIVGNSYQALSDPGPDCHSVIDSPYGVDHEPYPDPLVSGEAVRFTADGTPDGYGWLSESALDCYDGWQSDGLDPGGVAVDPNGGDVYSTADMDLGLIHLGPNLSNTNSNVGFPSAPCYSTDCPAGEWDLIAGNPPLSVAFDCRSDLYVLAGTNARAVVKFINQAPVPSSSCSPLLQRASMLSGITVFPRFGVNGRSGKASVLIGCQTRLCVGTVTLRSSSPLCRRCLLTTPLHIRIQPGVEKTVSLYLDRLGRRLLRQHPGLPIQVFGKLKGGRTVAESERLREPAALTDSCRFPGAPGGDASISGSLTPSHGQERISLEYVPPEAAGVFLPAVQRSVLTYASGRFADHYALGEAGRWTVIVSWGGDSTREPATAPVCVGAVQKAATQLTISCPSPSSIGTPGMFMGRLAGAPADASVAVVYEAPSGLLVAHDVTVGSGGDFSDAFAPTVAGNWKALGNYNGDADHEPTRASCAFTVPQPAPTSLSLDCTPDPDAHYISCLGSLELSGSGIGGAPISITYQPSAPGTSTIDSATTLADGSYGDTLSVAASGPPLAAGLWTVQAHYAGTSAYGPSSNSQNVTVP